MPATAPPNGSSVTSVQSMTGQGRASGATELGTVTVELRTVNNRGFKCSIRTHEFLSGYESMLESVVRDHLHRGSVNLSISLERDQGVTPQQINESVLAGYIRQCRAAIAQSASVQSASGQSAGSPAGQTATTPPNENGFSPSADGSGLTLNVGDLTSLPGVLSSEKLREDQAEVVWKQVQAVLVQALEHLIAMRGREGEHMAQTLLEDCAVVRQHVGTIETLGPEAAEGYRQRLESKVKRVLQSYGAEVDAVDLLREVQIFADKADVSEELTRLDSHLKLFESVLRGDHPTDVPSPSRAKESGVDEPRGRKLDFIIQEMFRETNTIGSKSTLAEVSALVVEIKCAIERMRELVQNLE